MFDLRKFPGLWRWGLIVPGLIFSLLPRLYWWRISRIFEIWLASYPDNSEQKRRAFLTHREFSLSLWLTVLGIFGIFITQGTFYPETTFNPSYRGEKRYFKCQVPSIAYDNSVLAGNSFELYTVNSGNNSFKEIELTGLLGEGVVQITSPKKGWIKAKNLRVTKPNCSTSS